MHQSKRVQLSFVCVELFFRMVLPALLLIGSVLTASPFMLSAHVSAQGASKTQLPHMMSSTSDRVVSSHTRVDPPGSGIAQRPQGWKNGPMKASHAHDTRPLTIKRANKVRPDVPAPQDLTVSLSAPGGPNFQVGQTLTLQAFVTNTSSTVTYDANSSIGVGMSLPAGLTNMVVSTSNWATNLSTITSPAIFTSLYTGPEVVPGGVFPLITISGVLTANAIPTFTTTPHVFAGVHAGITASALNVNVSSGPVTATATSTVTPTVTPPGNPVLGMAVNVANGPNYQVGQTITMTMTASNVDSTLTLGANNSVDVGDVFPYGMDNISALGGGNWSINTSSNTGPSLFTATYTGAPIAPGGNFPPITVTGTLTSHAVPGLQNITIAYSSDAPNANYGLAFLNLPVASPATVTPTATSLPASPTATSLPTSPTPTSLPTSPTPLLPSLPDLSLTQTSMGSNSFQIGQNVTYALNASSLVTGGPVGSSNPIKMTVVFPVGLTHVTASASNWTLLTTSTVSPTLIVAIYRGQYPVATGTHLPPILVQGTLLNTAVPQLTSTALLQVAGDSHPDNNLTTTTVQVSSLPPTVVAQPSPTPTSVVTPTVTISSAVAPLTTSLPDLSLTQASVGSSPFAAGQQLGYILSIKDIASSGSVTSLIRFTEVIPIGLTNVTSSGGTGWHITQSSTTSPLLINATYAGSYPVSSGTTLPPLIIIGKIASGSISSMTSTAVVSVAGDLNPNNNLATNTVFVTPSMGAQTSGDTLRQTSNKQEKRGNTL